MLVYESCDRVVSEQLPPWPSHSNKKVILKLVFPLQLMQITFKMQPVAHTRAYFKLKTPTPVFSNHTETNVLQQKQMEISFMTHSSCNLPFLLLLLSQLFQFNCVIWTEVRWEIAEMHSERSTSTQTFIQVSGSGQEQGWEKTVYVNLFWFCAPESWTEIKLQTFRINPEGLWSKSRPHQTVALL